MEKNLVIAISGPPGAGSSTISMLLAKKLKLRYLSPGKTYKSFLDEKEAEAALDFWKTKFGSSKKLHHDLDNEQIKEAKKGNIVICGKLSVNFLKNLSNCKVWLDVPLKIRAQRTAKRDNIPVKTAQKQILERQNLERKKWKDMYGFDYFNQKKQADMVLKGGKLKAEETVRRIIDYIT